MMKCCFELSRTVKSASVKRLIEKLLCTRSIVQSRSHSTRNSRSEAAKLGYQKENRKSASEK